MDLTVCLLSVQIPVCEEDTVINSGTQGSLHFIVCDYYTVKINTNVSIIKLSCYHYCSLKSKGSYSCVTGKTHNNKNSMFVLHVNTFTMLSTNRRNYHTNL